MNEWRLVLASPLFRRFWLALLTNNLGNWCVSASLPILVAAKFGAGEELVLSLGLRVLPKDGFPIVGFADGPPDIYVTAMHSGMTLGPLVGRLAAAEILDRVEVDLLAPYRLGRFAAGTAAH